MGGACDSSAVTCSANFGKVLADDCQLFHRLTAEVEIFCVLCDVHHDPCLLSISCGLVGTCKVEEDGTIYFNVFVVDRADALT